MSGALRIRERVSTRTGRDVVRMAAVLIVAAAMIWLGQVCFVEVSATDGKGALPAPSDPDTVRGSGSSFWLPSEDADLATSQPSNHAVQRSEVLGHAARIVGRVRIAANRQALSGADVICYILPSLSRRELRPPKARTRSDTEGRFDLAFSPQSDEQYVVTFEHPGLFRRYEGFPSLRSGASVDLGDIDLSPGGRVAGRFVTPVVGEFGEAQVMVRCRGPRLDPSAPGVISAYVASNGVFDLGFVPLGRHRLELMSRVWTLSPPVDIDVSVGEEASSLSLPVRQRRAVEGEVRMPNGEPVPGALVRPILDDLRAHNPVAETTTDRAGHFSIPAPDGEPLQSFGLVVQAAGYPEWRAPSQVVWGESIQVRLLPGVRVSLEIADATTRSRLPAARVARLRRGEYLNAGCPGGAQVTSGSDGLVLVAGLGDDIADLVVSATGYAPYRLRQPATGWMADSTIQVSLRPFAAIRVLLRDAHGQGLDGVELDVTGDSPAHALRGPLPALHAHIDVPRFRQVLAHGITDKTGVLRLADLIPGTCWVRCLGHGAAPFVHGPLEVPAGSDIDLTIPASRGSTVRGIISPVLASRTIEGIRLTDGDWGLPAQRSLESGWLVDAQGRFQAEHVPAGRWTVIMLRRVARARGCDEVSPQAQLVREALGSIVVDQDTEDLHLDASHLVPGAWTGRVMVDGQPAPKAMVAFQWMPGVAAGPDRGGWWSRRLSCDGNGSFTADSLEPGSYRAWCRVATRTESVVGILDHPIVLQAGTMETRDLTFRKGRLEVQFVSRTGQAPVVGMPVRVRHLHGQTGEEPLVISNNSGRISWPVLRPGRWEGITPSGQQLFRVEDHDLDRSEPLHVVVETER